MIDLGISVFFVFWLCSSLYLNLLCLFFLPIPTLFWQFGEAFSRKLIISSSEVPCWRLGKAYDSCFESIKTIKFCHYLPSKVLVSLISFLFFLTLLEFDFFCLCLYIKYFRNIQKCLWKVCSKAITYFIRCIWLQLPSFIYGEIILWISIV